MEQQTTLFTLVNGVTNGDMTQYAVTMAPIDGLALKASYYELGDLGGNENKQEKVVIFINYTIGSSVSWLW